MYEETVGRQLEIVACWYNFTSIWRTFQYPQL